ncbi:MAG: alpha/beta hydrolase, partial [Myxococcales bacterium]|nr:alpha/beta hydrolase [Myxococcales bacterium]
MAEPREQTLRIDDLDVFVKEVGEGPPLLLVHGFLVDHRDWDRMVPLLAPHFRCIAVDLPGFGRSGKPGPDTYDYSWQSYGATLAAVLTELRIDRAHVCGHSMGGGISLALAADHPDRVDRLVVLDGASLPFSAPLKGKALRIPILGKLMVTKLYGRALFRDYFENDVFNGGPGIDGDKLADYYRIFDTKEARECAYAASQMALDPSPVAARVPRIQTPTLVVWGSEDRVIPIEVGRRLTEELPDATFKIIDGAPHPI